MKENANSQTCNFNSVHNDEVSVATQNSCGEQISKRILHEKITKIFIVIGIPPHVNGYHFLREAIQLSIGNFDMLRNITKKLYPTVAKNFDTTETLVERSIRSAIEAACSKGKLVNLNNIFGIEVFAPDYRPSNSELIALLSEKIYLDCI